jgi:hypothetical protein
MKPSSQRYAEAVERNWKYVPTYINTIVDQYPKLSHAGVVKAVCQAAGIRMSDTAPVTEINQLVAAKLKELKK